MQGTVYEKTNAEVEMKKINREEFWEQAKVGVEWRKMKMDEGRKGRNSLSIFSISDNTVCTKNDINTVSL